MSGLDGNPHSPLNATWPAGSVFDNACVASLQWRLNYLGQNPPLKEDGLYGYYTSGALEVHLGRPLNHDLYPGTDDDVPALQSLIVACGFGIAVDGNWGGRTTQGLKLSLNAARF